LGRRLRIAVVGSGHNALVCACYLAQEGHRVTVFERTRQVGGAVCTEELFPGFRYDVGSSAHILIHATPILQELELGVLGLEYQELDPWAYYPTPDGPHLAFYRSLERTCDSIARVSPQDALAYRALVQDWAPLAKRVLAAFQTEPRPLTLFKHVMGVRPPGPSMALGLQEILSSYGDVVERRFRSEPVRAALLWLGAQSGPGPDERGSAPFLGWYAALHTLGAKRPRGGSGMLTQALARRLSTLGGEIRTEAAVARINLEDGRARAVTLESGERFASDVVVSGAHVRTTFDHLLAGSELPGTLRQEIARTRIGNGFGMAVRCATEELPRYTGSAPSDDLGAAHRGLQLLVSSAGALRRAHAEYLLGESAKTPALLAMSFSAIDPSLAPPGKHVLYLWSQYHPYARADGRSWDEHREGEADRILEQLFDFAPNLRGKVLHRHIQTPLDLERRFGLLRGNVMHLEMSLDQMFAFRPSPSLARYRTPVPGLFLTGASTHPGGGVFGASGRACARAVVAHA
jgi:phytoene dehydrogenase-like protein